MINEKEFTPKYIIGIGETSAYFTLRQTYLHKRYIPGDGPMGNAIVNGVYQGTCIVEVRSMHIQNLAQDAQEAFDKATEFSKQNAIPLHSTLEEIQQELREIKRASAEQLAERQAKIQARLDLQAEWEAERKAQFEAMLAEGKYPFGAYYNKPFAEAPRSYITWLITSIDTFEEGSDIKRMALAVAEVCPDRVLPTPDKGITIGTIGKRRNFNILVIRKAGYFTQYGYTHVITMIDKETNACLVSKGAFNAEVGEELEIKATVKEFSEYRDQVQTVIQRVAVQ